MTAALNWDAYDNYHDHDGAWTIYGLMRSARKIYTPKKRYYACRQMYRFVRPGWCRVEATGSSNEIPVLAFTDPSSGAFTLTGMNEGSDASLVNVRLEQFGGELSDVKADLYVTTEELNCARVAGATAASRIRAGRFDDIEITVPPKCIFTLTTVSG